MRILFPRVFLTACSRGSLHIGSDPIGTGQALAEADGPRGEDHEADSGACTDEIRGLLGDPLVLDGTVPDGKGPRTEGTATFGDVTVDVEHAHDLSAGASATPVAPLVFDDGSTFQYPDFSTDRTLRVNTTHPGRRYCWTWFELL